MSTRRRIARTAFGLLALVAGLACCLLVGVLTLGRVEGLPQDLVVYLAWACGLTCVLLGVAAVQEHTDPDDDPRYFETILHGLVDEWRR